MRAIANEQLEGLPKRNELKSVFAEHETESEEVGVQDDGFPILSSGKQEFMRSTGIGYLGGPDPSRRTLSSS